MKILQTCFSKSWGGREMEALKISNKLTENGHSVFLSIPISSRLHKEAAAYNKISIYPISGKYYHKLKMLIRFIKKEKFDVIHTHLSHDLGILAPALFLSGSKSKLFITKHVASGINKKDILHRLLYHRVEGIFAISTYIKNNILETCPIKEKKVHLVPNGIDLCDFVPGKFNKEIIRKSLNISEGSKVIGVVGRITPLKGHKEFILAADILRNELKEAVFLIIGGASYGEEKYENEIKELVKKLKLESRIKFLGFRQDITQILSLLDILAFPSYEESFGLILIESMAMKVPVVAVGNAGVLDIIKNNESGILIPPHDAASLADGIMKLLSNSRIREDIIEQGRKRVEKYFDINKYIGELERFYVY